MGQSSKRVILHYYALLREERGLPSEARMTDARTPRELYRELSTEFALRLDLCEMMVAINGEFADFEVELSDGDEVVFIPPVAGGAEASENDGAI